MNSPGYPQEYNQFLANSGYNLIIDEKTQKLSYGIF